MMARLNQVLKRSARIHVSAVGSARIRSLNRTYRGRDCPTNVLSIGWGASRSIVGDIFLCPAVIREEVGRSAAAKRTHHLIVHGVLHILGYDHEGSVAQARTMERLEQKILGWNPYENSEQDKRDK